MINISKRSKIAEKHMKIYFSVCIIHYIICFINSHLFGNIDIKKYAIFNRFFYKGFNEYYVLFGATMIIYCAFVEKRLSAERIREYIEIESRVIIFGRLVCFFQILYPSKNILIDLYDGYFEAIHCSELILLYTLFISISIWNKMLKRLKKSTPVTIVINKNEEQSADK